MGRVLGPGRWRALLAGSAALAAVGVLAAVSPAVASASPQQALNWTKLAPAAQPSARYQMAMAYDGANGTVVLFGGYGAPFADTWTWNGTTWTQQHPATHPSFRVFASMAYDAANGTVVLFGGINTTKGHVFGDTWTWNGTTWTEQHPAVHPSARDEAQMAYDAATGTVVLFGGSNGANDTWTWNGTTWTQQHPATSPPARYMASMAYDAATGTEVLFGGL
jgi:hypothetical protein